MKTLTYKLRDLEPGEAALTKAIDVPDKVLTQIAKEASKSLNDFDTILVVVTCKVEVMVVVKKSGKCCNSPFSNVGGSFAGRTGMISNKCPECGGVERLSGVCADCGWR